MEDDAPDHRLLNHRHCQPRVIHCNCDADYEAALREAGKSLVVVDAFAEWCGPCRQIAPTFAALSGEYEDVAFLKVDVDACPRTKAALGIMAMPTFVFMQEGKRVGGFPGASERLLRKGLDNNGRVSVCSYVCPLM